MVAAIRGEQESDRAAMNRVGELLGVGTGEIVRKLVSAAKSFTPSKYAVGGEDFKNAVEMTVTLKNGTSENYDPGQFFATMQSGDEEGDSIYDANVGSSPSTSLLPGRCGQVQHRFMGSRIRRTWSCRCDPGSTTTP